MNTVKLLFYMVIGISTLSFLHTADIPEHIPRISKDTALHVDNLMRSFRRAHRVKPTIWLTGKETKAQEQKKVLAFAKKIRSVIASTTVDSPDLRHIKSYYKTFTMCVYKDQKLYQPGTNTLCKKKTQVPVFSVMSYGQYRKHYKKLAARFFYDHSMQTTIWVAYRMPKILFRGILLHELGHVVRIEKNLRRKRRVGDKTRNAEEEARMHTLELQVMDKESGGGITSLYEKICQRTTVCTPDSALAQVDIDDVESYHIMLGETRLGYGVIYDNLGQFFIGLGLYAIQKSDYDTATPYMHLNLIKVITKKPYI